MSLEGHAKLHQSEKSRTLIYVSQKVVSDSAFPFKPGQNLIVRIDPDGGRLIFEVADD